ncbi:MAG: polysaccharide deacetylase [archaeon]|nr:polysaccharide deacetylase [archaeon]
MPLYLPSGKKYAVCLTFDFDAISLWIGTFRSTSPSYISRGEYGAKCGVPRILELLEKHRIVTTFFIPGHTIETYPEVCDEIRKHGHEIACHNYCHENPLELNYQEENRVIRKGIRAIEWLTGKEPIGYRSPAWDVGPNTIKILENNGFQYDSSLMGDDKPYRCRTGDKASLHRKYLFGKHSKILELPVTWSLDDFWRFEMVLASPPTMGVNTPKQVFEMWSSEFEFQYNNVPGGLFNSVCHPQVSGRGHRLIFLDNLIQFMKGYKGVWFARCADVLSCWRD